MSGLNVPPCETNEPSCVRSMLAATGVRLVAFVPRLPALHVAHRDVADSNPPTARFHVFAVYPVAELAPL